MTEGLDDLDDIVRTLRASGGDTTNIEVKAAGGGLPVSLTASMSALANLPGGPRRRHLRNATGSSWPSVNTSAQPPPGVG